MKEVDTLIIGQGIAGSCLAYFLMKRGQRVMVIDDGHRSSATKIAAGMMDYISGQRFTLSWQSKTLIPFAKMFYQSLETLLNTSFFMEAPSFRYFSTENEQLNWRQKFTQAAFKHYYGPLFKTSPVDGVICDHHGVVIKDTSVLKTAPFLLSFRDYLYKQDSLIEDSFHFNVCEVTSSVIKWNDLSAKRLIFSTGHHVASLPWTRAYPFKMAKGETLTLTSPTLPAHIFNKGKWLVPLGDTRFRFGASYEWADLIPAPTKQGYHFLNNFLATWLLHDYSIEALHSGVRCTVSDLRPLCGFFTPNIGIFSGMGSKGVMLAPYYAERFSEMICDGAPLNKEVSIERFR